MNTHNSHTNPEHVIFGNDSFPETIIQPYDAVAVLGCLVQKTVNESNGQTEYIPADHTQADRNGMLAGNFRVDGAAALYLGRPMFPGPSLYEQSNRFIFTGGITKPVNAELTSDVPTEAEVYAQAFKRRVELALEDQPVRKVLADRVGDPEIILETESDTTLNGIRAVITMALERQYERVLFLTNHYHWLRATAMGALTMSKMIAEDRIHNRSLSVRVHGAEGYAVEAFGHSQAMLHMSAYFSNDKAQIVRSHDRSNAEAAGLVALDEGVYNHPEWNEVYHELLGTNRERITDVLYKWARHDRDRVRNNRSSTDIFVHD